MTHRTVDIQSIPRSTHPDLEAEFAIRAREFSESIRSLRGSIEADLPGSREKALVLTKLDEGEMWLKALLA